MRVVHFAPRHTLGNLVHKFACTGLQLMVRDHTWQFNAFGRQFHSGQLFERRFRQFALVHRVPHVGGEAYGIPASHELTFLCKLSILFHFLDQVPPGGHRGRPGFDLDHLIAVERLIAAMGLSLGQLLLQVPAGQRKVDLLALVDWTLN